MRDCYAALLVDLKHSRKYKGRERELLQCMLGQAVSYLNMVFATAIASPVVFSAGDEVQGLFNTPFGAFLYYRALLLILGRDTLRGGMGVGAWETVVQGAPSTAQDGSAYHYARAALEEAKRSRTYQLVIQGLGNIDSRATTLLGYPLSIIEARTSEQSCIAFWAELLRPVIINEHHAVYGLEAGRLRDELFELSLSYRGEGVAETEKMSNEDEQDCDLRCAAFSAALFEPVFVRDLLLPGRNRDTRGLAGLGTLLAPIAGKSRQSVDKSIARAHLAQERDATALVVDFLMRLEG